MSFTVLFRPRKDGLAYDPLPFGGGVDLLRVFDTPARNTTPVATVTGAERRAAGLYAFTVPNLPDGTYYLAITWRENATEPAYTDLNDRITLPAQDPLIRRLRALTGEPDPEGTYTDADLAGYLDANTTTRGQVDLYAAAADVWEEKAAVQVAQAATAQGQIQSVSTSDQSVTYATAGAAPGSAAAQQARAMRARSFAKTTRLNSPGAYPWHLRPEQVDAGIGHALGYAPEAADLAGIHDQ